MNERDTLLQDRIVAEALTALAQGRLGTWIQKQRWSAAQGRIVESVAVADCVTLDPAPPAHVLALIDVGYADTPAPQRYAVPLALYTTTSAATPLGRVTIPGAAEVTIVDASEHVEVPRALLAAIVSQQRRKTTMGGQITGRSTSAMPLLLGGRTPDALSVSVLQGEQSNTSYVLGDCLVLKLFRKLQHGPHPDVEVTEFLTRVGFAHVPRLAGVLTYQTRDHYAAEITVAVAQQFVVSRGDAWTTTLENLRRVLREGDLQQAAEPMRTLGEITAEMHIALASDPTTPEFAPEPWGREDRNAWIATMARRIDEIEAACGHAGDTWSPSVWASVEDMVRQVRDRWHTVRAVVHALPEGLCKIRVHGDYHLGQVLTTEHGFVLIDFEGEPLRTLAERRAKGSPLRDVAGMLRSFAYVAHVAAEEVRGTHEQIRAMQWERAAREMFLLGYLTNVREAAVTFVPRDPYHLHQALALFELDKALYEVMYEITHRPEWIPIPVEGVHRALAAINDKNHRGYISRFGQ